MKCPKCGKEFNESNSIASNTFICPFCAGNFGRDGSEKEDIKEIFKSLIELHGVALLDDIRKTNALLMDYAPHSDKERKLVVMALREGVSIQLTKVVNEDETVRQERINKCVKQLMDSVWITETAARYAVLVLAGALGMQVEIHKGEQEQRAQSDVRHEESGTSKILTKEAGISSEDAIAYALRECDVIGYKALAANTNIRHLVLPAGVKYVYPKAFLNCINLSKISIPGDIRGIGRCAFEGCSSLERIEITDGVNYRVVDGVLIDKVNKLALRAENDGSKETVRIVNGISTICKKAFERSKVKCIGIPMSVSRIEENAFFLTQNLERFEVDPKNNEFRALDGVLHDRKAKVLVMYPQGKNSTGYFLEDTVEEIGLQAFSCAQNLQSITFTGALKRIGNKAFEYCVSLENVMLPGNVEIIGDRAFQYCEKMRGIMLSRNIQEIGDCAFYNCISLETVSVPKNVTKIGNLAFANCKKMRTVTVQENVTFVGDGAFSGCDNVELQIKNNTYMENYCRSRGIKFSNI